MIRRAALTLLVAYTLLFGATYNGILDARLRLADAVIVGVVLVVWLLSRRWRWHATPLDGAVLVWIAAFALSLVANAEAWRRIAIGLWFMGLYIGVWYILHDAFANGGLRRAWLVDALLISGIVPVFFGYAQVQVALVGGAPLPRPVGTLGNANSLASLLVLLLPLCAGRLIAARKPLGRTLYGFYGAVMLVLLLLTFSRGGWVGAAVGLAVWAMLSLPLRRRWSALRRPLRLIVVVTAVLALILVLYVVVESLGIGGRGLDLRTFLYETALRLFAEKPLTGSGLFTFGAGLSRLNSIPPVEPHSHAHNVILHVAAELGIVGLLALALTGWAFLRALRALRRDGDPVARMGAAAFAGFAAHQMLDLPAMMPALALVALAALALALPATVPRRQGRLQPALVALGGLILTLTGLWSALSYREYVSALSEAVASGDYRVGASRLASLAEADPSLAIYHEERAMLLGLQAASGDLDAAREAADAFTRYLALEPSYVSGWANLAALDAQLGKSAEAAAAIQRAIALAPQSAPILYQAGLYFEAAGDLEAARAAYNQAVAIDPDLILVPGWNDSRTRQSVGDESRLSPLAQVVVRLERGDVSGAQALWDTFPSRGFAYSNIDVIRMALALAQGNQTQAEAALAGASRDALSANDRAWVHLGAALHDDSRFDAEIAAARAALELAPTASEWDVGPNIAYIQYLHLAIPRLFLPQFGYPVAESLLQHLLGDDAALAGLRAVVNPQR